MYCSSCGVAVVKGLTYCNYCGAKLVAGNGGNVVKSSDTKPELVVAAMVAVFVLGLVAITILLGVMKSELAFNSGQILAFAVLSFLIMIFLEGAFLRLLFRRDRVADKRGATETLKGQTTNELPAAQARALREPALTVTEHTTRAFDPVYTERDKG